MIILYAISRLHTITTALSSMLFDYMPLFLTTPFTEARAAVSYYHTPYFIIN